MELPGTAYLPEAITLLADRRVSRWLLHVPFPYGPVDGRRFLARATAGRRAGSDLALWAIEERSNRLVGGVGLHHFAPRHRRAEVGYWIGRPYWGRGFATEAVGRLVEVAFATLRLERLDASTFDGNRRSGHVLTKLGFVCEGSRPRSFAVQGRWRSDVMYGRLRSARHAAGRDPTTDA
jgi:RimJ/RimL family protein N-acetyltransferase